MSDGEIIKIDQRTGQAGRPKQVKIHGAKGLGTASPIPTTLGAAPAHGPTEIVDRHTPRPQDEQPVEVVQHGEDVTDSNAIRSAPVKESGVQIRVRSMDGDDRKEWDRIRSGKDDQ